MASVNPKEGCCLLGGRVCLHDFCLGGWVFCFIYSALASASPCVEENKETNSGGGEESQTEPSPSGTGWERPGRSRGRCRGPRRGAGSRAPRPLRADPARILHVSFLFFLPFFFLPLLFFPLFPPLFPPSLPPQRGWISLLVFPAAAASPEQLSGRGPPFRAFRAAGGEAPRGPRVSAPPHPTRVLAAAMPAARRRRPGAAC